MHSSKPSLITVTKLSGFKLIMNHDTFQIVKKKSPAFNFLVEAGSSAMTRCFRFPGGKMQMPCHETIQPVDI